MTPILVYPSMTDRTYSLYFTVLNCYGILTHRPDGFTGGSVSSVSNGRSALVAAAAVRLIILY